ncbi:pentapeptide repeat-containing protein [Halobacillus naozhouensis]|uniref:Pentapeptide repeat-containing protein n=1 Tax=Halobacillus naozhouensis TaxID=554880 RepID=A0ABY8J628_9BACI|nr:hypothetical protein [Halobacillus naozhouensis]WFT77029.1 hypothetical protein P9989_17575 [Halobacillus naozhouensis]
MAFENCDLSNTSFLEGVLHRATFKNCKLVVVMRLLVT